MCTLKLGVPQKRLVTSSKAAAKYPEERVNKPGCSANHKDILKGAGIPKLQQIQKSMISQMLLSFFGITAQYLTFPSNRARNTFVVAFRKLHCGCIYESHISLMVIHWLSQLDWRWLIVTLCRIIDFNLHVTDEYKQHLSLKSVQTFHVQSASWVTSDFISLDLMSPVYFTYLLANLLCLHTRCWFCSCI